MLNKSILSVAFSFNILKFNKKTDCSAAKCDEGNQCVLGKYLLKNECDVPIGYCAEREIIHVAHERYELDNKCKLIEIDYLVDLNPFFFVCHSNSYFW